MLQNSVETPETKTTHKRPGHRRGRRGSRNRKSSTASLNDDSQGVQTPSAPRRRHSSSSLVNTPAVQSIQDIISEIKRLPISATSPTSPTSTTTTTRRLSSSSSSTTSTSRPSGRVRRHSETPQSIAKVNNKDDLHLAWPTQRSRSQSVPDIKTAAVMAANHHPSHYPGMRRQLYPTHLPLADVSHQLKIRALFSGTLHVDRQDSSDAHVMCDTLGANIYIYGSRNRNRALDGDVVAVELVDVGTMLAEKATKKQARRRSSLAIPPPTSISLSSIPEHSMLDDSDRRPAFCGRVVCIMERPRRLFFSGILSLHRPQQHDDAQESAGSKQAPKIIWFIPADKRLPLVAVPVKHAPAGFLKYPDEYRHRIFVGAIQRWPATSLHPFGSIEREIGWMGELSVHSQALMADYHLKDDSQFTPGVLKSVQALAPDNYRHRIDLRESVNPIFSLGENLDVVDCAYSIRRIEEDNLWEIGIHVSDLASLVHSHTALDEEAKERGIMVDLVERQIPMFPLEFIKERAALLPGLDRLAYSVHCHITPKGTLLHSRVNMTIIRCSAHITFKEAQSILDDEDKADMYQVRLFAEACRALRKQRHKEGGLRLDVPRQIFDLCDKTGYPKEMCLREEPSAWTLFKEADILANCQVAQKITSKYPEQALLCRQEEPRIHALDPSLDIIYDYLTEKEGKACVNFSEMLAAASSYPSEVKRMGLEYCLRQAIPTCQFFAAQSVDIARYRHYTLGVPLYTIFTEPLQKYASIVVQRQLHATLRGGCGEKVQSPDNVEKTARHCNVKQMTKEAVYEQSILLYVAAYIYQQVMAGPPIITTGLVMAVQSRQGVLSIVLYLIEFGIIHDVTLPTKKTYACQYACSTYSVHDCTADIVWRTNASKTAMTEVEVMVDGMSPTVIEKKDPVEEEQEEEDQEVQAVHFLDTMQVRIKTDMKHLKPSLEIELVNPF
ncbi:hypothetical protein BCR43DRAFT_491479 [Syncephalastrum racemosum]|uniref:RNB domain-containing protein n=1 Tax=Syncephalastrum racemosum TaxID=13706 RepID=A0A1X2HBX9_SYNRA|nr:hypothetical protein BCR43DRAFT_491479 [Syncephalastrum racemosum]